VGSQSVPDTAHAAAVNTNALASACISCNTIPPASTLPPQTASIAQLQEQQLPPAGPASSTPALALTYLEDVLESAGARPLCCSTLCQLQLTARWLWAQPQGLAQAVPPPVSTAHVCAQCAPVPRTWTAAAEYKWTLHSGKGDDDNALTDLTDIARRGVVSACPPDRCVCHAASQSHNLQREESLQADAPPPPRPWLSAGDQL
jgi:hypothetical protein